jgi:hypothetical protein
MERALATVDVKRAFGPIVEGEAVFADITITEGWSRPVAQVVSTGDWVRVDPVDKRITVLRRAARNG